jgi:hypothetical protein
MMQTSTLLEMKVQSLLAVLDDDIRHVQTALEQLDRLRGLLIKRDHAGLERLLIDLASQADIYAVNEQKRQHLRQELADELKCSPDQVTLSRLASFLPDALRSGISERQKTLKSQAGKLKREHKLTSDLIADCARFNQALLRLFLGQHGRGTVRYGANGAPVPRADAALMSLHF